MLTDAQISLLTAIATKPFLEGDDLAHVDWTDLKTLWIEKFVELGLGAFQLTEKGEGYVLALHAAYAGTPRGTLPSALVPTWSKSE